MRGDDVFVIGVGMTPFGQHAGPVADLAFEAGVAALDDAGIRFDAVGALYNGYIGGGMLKRESPADRPVITIDVDDIDEALAKIEELGGQTLLGKQEVREMGWAAYFKDAEGNTMGLWQTA